jgi:predicted nucleic acid-binding protein
LIVLDTNILSAVMRSPPEPAVVAWLNRQPAESIWTTAITIFEIEMGIQSLAIGKKRFELARTFVRAMSSDLEDRILTFDRDSALAAAKLAADRRRVGRVIDFRDTQIAGIAIAHRAAIATRNTRHFSDLQVDVIDPWAE